jgi:hypothetical protein
MRLEFVPLLRPYRVLVVDMPHSFGDIRHTNALDVVQSLGQDFGILDPALIKGLELLELLDAYGCRNIRHPIIVADHCVLVPGLLAVVPKEATAVCYLDVVGGDHTALAGGHVLGGVEGVAGAGADGAGHAGLVERAVGLAGVFDDGDGVSGGEGYLALFLVNKLPEIEC